MNNNETSEVVCEWCGSDKNVELDYIDGKSGYLCQDCREYMDEMLGRND